MNSIYIISLELFVIGYSFLSSFLQLLANKVGTRKSLYQGCVFSSLGDCC